MRIVISSRRILRTLLIVQAALTLAHIAVGTWHHFLRHPDRFGLMRQFSLDEEANIPTYYAALLLLAAASLLALIAAAKAREKDPYRRHWAALSIVLLYMSIDEACMIHETWSSYLPSLHRGAGIMHFPWIPVGIAVVALVAVSFIRFFLHLPRTTRMLMGAAAAAYVAGALGMEMLAGILKDVTINQGISYAMVSTTEENLEMLGMALFIFALLSYISEHMPRLELSVSPYGKIPEAETPTDARPELD